VLILNIKLIKLYVLGGFKVAEDSICKCGDGLVPL